MEVFAAHTGARTVTIRNLGQTGKDRSLLSVDAD
jgi:hypothetical protein